MPSLFHSGGAPLLALSIMADPPTIERATPDPGDPPEDRRSNKPQFPADVGSGETGGLIRWKPTKSGTLPAVNPNSALAVLGILENLPLASAVFDGREVLRHATERFWEICGCPPDHIHDLNDLARYLAPTLGEREETLEWFREQRSAKSASAGFIDEDLEAETKWRREKVISLELPDREATQVKITIIRRLEADDQDPDATPPQMPTLNLHPFLSLLVLLEPVGESDEVAASFLHAQRGEFLAAALQYLAPRIQDHLIGVLGYNSLIKKNIEMGENPAPYLQKLEEIGEQASDLLGKLSKLAVFDSSRLEELNLNATTEDIIDWFNSKHGKRLGIRTNYGPSLWPVLGTEVELTLMVKNILENAVEAVEDQTDSRIAITTANLEIDALFLDFYGDLKAGPHVYLSIEDNGIGMDPRTFAAAKSPRFTTRRGRQGLGLTVANQIVERLGGRLAIYSEEGLGTTVKVMIPAEKRGQKREANEWEITPPPLRKQTLLLVDDDSLVLRVAGDIMEHYGFRVIRAASYEEAEEFVKAGEIKFEYAILDLNLDGVSCEGIFDQIREIYPETRVVISSGLQNDPRIETLLHGGAIAFLQKPFRAEDLQELFMPKN